MKETETCIYYPIFCKGIGHTTAGDKRCDMNGKSKEEKMASDNMQDEMIEKYLAKEKESM